MSTIAPINWFFMNGRVIRAPIFPRDQAEGKHTASFFSQQTAGAKVSTRIATNRADRIRRNRECLRYGEQHLLD